MKYSNKIWIALASFILFAFGAGISYDAGLHGVHGACIVCDALFFAILVFLAVEGPPCERGY